MSYCISIDTGGTFTDVVVRDSRGVFTLGKALTTPGRAFEGIRGAIAHAASELHLSTETLLAATRLLIYGTTRATNAIVTQNVARTALLTTAGFADTLLMREGGKSNPHDFSQEFPLPCIPRRHTFEIEERIGSNGEIVIPLNTDQAAREIARVKGESFEAVAVCLLWSVANPMHEIRIGELLEAALPGVPYTLSHELLPVVREYRRASAAAIDASLKPLMQAHLRDLERDLRAAGYDGEILVSTLSGGCSNIEALIDKPIYSIGSGPAMAPIAAINYASIEGMGEDVMVCDTGGTTFDVGIVRDGRPTYSRETWLGPRYRGHLLGISAVDIRSVGAGGGSIAWIDDGGLMRVGPESAGSLPGPACYGRGGTLPTVSDAAAVLGYFDPDYFLGGRMKLDLEAARRAIGGIAQRIGHTVEETAVRILGLATDLMVRAIEDLTVNEGINPRESVLVAGGGAAGINIMQIASELGCRRAIVPSSAGALSAAGMQFADIIREEARSLPCLSTRFDAQRVNSLFDELEARLEAFRLKLSGDTAEFRIERFAEARYLGQIWELDTPVQPRRFLTESDVESLVSAFHDLHERIFAVRDPGSPVEIVSWKVRLTVALPKPPALRLEDGSVMADHSAHRRTCFFGAGTGVDTPIYKAMGLTRGSRIVGPAIIEEPTTTLVVYPNTAVTVSRAGHYLLETA